MLRAALSVQSRLGAREYTIVFAVSGDGELDLQLAFCLHVSCGQEQSRWRQKSILYRGPASK